MIVSRGILLAALLALSMAGSAVAAPKDDARVQQALERGNLIYAYDQAAWRSTDAMVESLPKARVSEIKGWLVEPDGDALSVLYYGYDGDTPYGVFRARFENGKVAKSGEIAADAPRALTPVETRMALARKVAADSNPPACVRKPFNTVIVPPASDAAPVEVYLLTPQMQAGVYPFGLHYLVTVGADGKAASTRPFMKSCMNQPVPENAVGAMITHMLDPTPTEIHAWLSRWTGKPVYVMVAEPEQLWEVTPKAMRKVKEP